MKKIIISLMLLVTSVLAVNEFTIAKSRDDKVCNQILDLLNNDLNNRIWVNLDKHKEFNWIHWKPLKEKYQDSFYVAHFDINNDDINESVFLYKGQWNYYDTESIYYMTEKNGDSIEIEYDDSKIRDGQLVEKGLGKISGTWTNAFRKYKENKCNKNIESVEYVEILGEKVDSIYLGQYFPLKLDGVYYIAVFGYAKSRMEQKDIAADGRDMTNEGNVMMLIKFDKNNRRDNICFLQRNNYRLNQGTK